MMLETLRVSFEVRGIEKSIALGGQASAQRWQGQ